MSTLCAAERRDAAAAASAPPQAEPRVPERAPHHGKPPLSAHQQAEAELAELFFSMFLQSFK